MKQLAKLFFALAVSCSFIVSCAENTDLGADPVIDTSPTISIISPVNNASVADLVDIEVEASDDRGVYKVEFYIDGDNVYRDPAPPYVYLWDASGYEHGSGHSIYAEAFDTDGNSTTTKPIICIIDTTMAIPEPVILYAGQNVTTSSVLLEWTKSAVNDFDKYVLRYDLNNTGDFEGTEVVIALQVDTTLVVTELFDTAQYRFQVLVVDIMGNSSSSNSEFVTTLNSPPPQPTIDSIYRLGDRVSITWSNTDILDFSSYEVYRSTDQNYDLSDELLATITEPGIRNYDYITTDSSEFYCFVVLNEESGLSSVSQYYHVLQQYSRYALSYDGSTYCTVPYFSELDVGETYTLEAWIYQSAKSTYMRVIDKSPTGDPYLQYSLISDEYLGADMCGNGVTQRYHCDFGVTLNVWHHVALTYDYGQIIYYIDGQAVDTNQTGIGSACSHPTTLNIGRRKLFNEFYFRGIIDEVRVWNVVRTPGQIGSTYDLHLSASEPGLVCSFGFDEGQGQVITTPVGVDGYLGEVGVADSKDPTWVESTAPIWY